MPEPIPAPIKDTDTPSIRELTEAKDSAVNVYTNPRATSAELKAAVTSLHEKIPISNCYLPFFRMSPQKQELSAQITEKATNHLNTSHISYPAKFHPFYFRPASSYERCESAELNDAASQGKYYPVQDDIKISKQLAEAAQAQPPYPVYFYTDVLLHEHRHRKNWSSKGAILDFLERTTRQNTSSTSSIRVGQVASPDVVLTEVTAKCPPVLVWIDEAVCYIEHITISGAMDLAEQISHMEHAEVYMNRRSPGKGYAELITVLTAAAYEMGLSPEDVIKITIDSYQGVNPKNLTHSLASIDGARYEKEVLERIQNTITDAGKQLGLINAQLPGREFDHLTELAKRYFLRARLKKEIADACFMQSLTEQYAETPTAHEKVLIEDDPSYPAPTRILLALDTPLPAQLKNHKTHLLVESSLSYTAYTGSAMTYTLDVCEVNRITGNSESWKGTANHPNITDKEIAAIAKEFVNDLPTEHRDRLITTAKNTGLFFMPDSSYHNYQIGEAILREFKARGFITETQLQKYIYERESVYAKRVYRDSAVSLIKGTRSIANPDIIFNKQGNLRVSTEENVDMKVVSVDLAGVYPASEQSRPVLSIILPKSHVLRLAAQRPEWNYMNQVKFRLSTSDTDINVTNSQYIEYPEATAIMLVNNMSKNDRKELAKALREGRYETSTELEKNPERFIAEVKKQLREQGYTVEASQQPENIFIRAAMRIGRALQR